ncbi:MAG: hypothetical protein U9O94_03500 [Nanoarchaeota archaeon]|nr:hypothetical protein [Nanoarchaeota archaeon]
MKYIFSAIIALIILVLASYIAVSEEENSYKLKTYTIENNKQNTESPYKNLMKFEIHQESGKSELINIIKDTKERRKLRLKYIQRDEEIDDCIEEITKNWKRANYKLSYEMVYDKEKEEWIHEEGSPYDEKKREFHGYDEDKDWKLRWRLRNRALEGKEIC